ncbi:MAG: D-alanyl-D-alanine carboxypeptidase family protein [Armatimonadota bacterium]|nr:D-alanyl-D-alanine carboxypeptidase family protein [Armatimonadota bacterium]
MPRDNLFAPRHRRRGSLARFALVGCIAAAGLLLLRPIAGRAIRRGAVTPPEVKAQVVCETRPVGVPPQVSAQSAILMDADSETVLYQKDAHTRRPMASLTKMMTAILVIEHAAPTDVVTASEHASLTPFTGLYLKKGEKATVEDLLWGMLLRSANDACVAAGEHVAGSEQAFVEMMNAKARELHLNDTHFQNPHGLHAEGHYSSAYDLARLACYCMRNPRFAAMAGWKRKRIDRSMEKQDVVVVNKNRLLFRWNLADGIKTGYTRQAGHCLAASASQGGWRLVAVVLKSADAFSDARALLEHGFRQYERVMVVRKDAPVTQVPVAGGTRREVPLVAARQFSTVAAKGAKTSVALQTLDLAPLRAPIERGAAVGTLVVCRADRELERIPLLAGDDVPAARFAAFSVPLGGALVSLVAILSLRSVARYGRKASKNPRRRRNRLSPPL